MLNGTNETNTELNNQMPTQTKSRELPSSEKWAKCYRNEENARTAALRFGKKYNLNLRFMVVACNESPQYRVMFFLNEKELPFAATIASAGHQVIA